MVKWFGRGLMFVGGGALSIAFTPISNMFSATLLVAPSIRRTGAVVVLNGGIYPNGSPGDETLRRTVHGASLIHEGYAKTLILSGGPGTRSMMRVLQALGCTDDNILLEERSDRTYEQAIEVAALLRHHKIKTVLLVSDPTHMYRAVLTFRKQGVETYPAPTDDQIYLADDPGHRLYLFQKVMREYLGLVLYKMRGWI